MIFIKEYGSLAAGFIGMAIAVIAGFTMINYITTEAWNSLAPLFNLPTITIMQAFAAYILFWLFLCAIMLVIGCTVAMLPKAPTRLAHPRCGE